MDSDNGQIVVHGKAKAAAAADPLHSNWLCIHDEMNDDSVKSNIEQMLQCCSKATATGHLPEKNMEGMIVKGKEKAGSNLILLQQGIGHSFSEQQAIRYKADLCVCSRCVIKSDSISHLQASNYSYAFHEHAVRLCNEHHPLSDRRHICITVRRHAHHTARGVIRKFTNRAAGHDHACMESWCRCVIRQQLACKGTHC